jgi:indolepyruvate ferredoxin oxidoreductase beta subunit
MKNTTLLRDPYNIIITGVGGQGNVMSSRVLGSMLADKGFFVTIGETFGPSQRGGSVMSHLRISGKSSWSPQIPEHKANIIAALEPIEAIRVLALYGSPEVKILCNTRPIYPVTVTRGEKSYPSIDEIKKSITELAPDSLFIDATEEAQKLGNPILANIIMLGAICGSGTLPLEKKDFEEAITDRVKNSLRAINCRAFDIGMGLSKG